MRPILMLPLAPLTVGPAIAQDAVIPALEAGHLAVPFEEGSSLLAIRGGLVGSLPDDDRDILVWGGRLERSTYFRDHFALVGGLDALLIDGDPEQPLPDADTGGVGASVLLRWHFLVRGRWSWLLEYGVGLIASRADFPPGGTRLNGSREVSLGVTVRLTEALDLILGVRQQHVSNGRGLGDDNPSFDGLGPFVGLLLPIGAADRPSAKRAPLPPVEAWPWTVRLEARGGEVDDDGFGGGSADVDLALGRSVRAQLYAARDDVDGNELTELEGALYLQGPRGRFGLSFGRQELSVFSTNEIGAFGEYFANDLVSVMGAVAREDRSHARDRWLGGVFLRVYPLQNLMLQTGPGFALREGRDFHADDIDLAFGLEYLPGFLESSGLSVFAEERIDDHQLVGLRWQLGGRGPLLNRHRSGGALRVRL